MTAAGWVAAGLGYVLVQCAVGRADGQRSRGARLAAGVGWIALIAVLMLIDGGGLARDVVRGQSVAGWRDVLWLLWVPVLWGGVLAALFAASAWVGRAVRQAVQRPPVTAKNHSKDLTNV